MRNTNLKKITDFFKVFSGFIIAVPLLIAGTVQAVTMYSAGSLLQPNDVTSSHIRDNTIVNADVNTAAAIIYSKLTAPGVDNNVTFNTSGVPSADPAFRWYTSGRTLMLSSGTIAATSTNFNGVAYTWPSADGSTGQALKTNGSGTMSWGTVSSVQTLSTLTAGQSLSTGNAVFMASSTVYSFNELNTNQGTASNFNYGNTGGLDKTAQSFTETSAMGIGAVKLYMSKGGTPVDNSIISIQADNAGAPSGTMLASSTLANATLTGSAVETTLTLDVPVYTTANTKYWVVLQRSGANDNTNTPTAWGTSPSPTYANGAYASLNGATWTVDTTKDYQVKLVNVGIAGKVYKTDATTFPGADTFVGFAGENITAGASGNIITGGVASGLSGLSAGLHYYITNTQGAVGTTAGTITRKVGTAVSSTEMLINNIW